MAFQSTIDRINEAITALGQAKDLLLLGGSSTPNSYDILDVASRARIVSRALDAVCLEYDIDDAGFLEHCGDVEFDRAADLADERLREPRGFRCLIDEDYDR